MPRVIVIKGTDEGKQFELGGAAAGVGRESGNRIRLTDTEASRRHAEFRPTKDGFRLADVGSANGTFVNGQPIKDVLLRPGDQIQIGQTVLVFSAGPGEAPARSDLAQRISMITRQDAELSSAILRTVGEAEGSRILARPETAKGEWLQTALANLRILYEASQAVSHILDVDQLLERILDLLMRSIPADRACVMLRHPDTGRLEPKAVRLREGADEDETIAVSRTIMDYVLAEKKGVLASDAARDERFSAGQSIARIGIREVICVPMKGRHETLGVLYLDTRTPARDALVRPAVPTKFSDEHLSLAIAVAHQAALAVEETRYYQAMVQAERLAAIGQAVATLSHHIKNILQGLRSGSEILKMGLGDKDEVMLQQGWKIVEKNQAKIYHLVMDMLSYSKEREPAVEPTDLNAVVRDVLELAEPRAKELNIRLESHLQADLPPVPADPEGLHRAVLNIVGNAFDAVEESEAPAVVVETAGESGGAWARVTVTDNGVGIPPEKLPGLFRPFVSTKGARGTGLGLAVSRKILREHGGDILVQSQPGQGSRFVLRLPLKSPPGQEQFLTRPPTPPAPPEG